MSKQEVRTKTPFLWPVGDGGLVQPDRVVAVGRWRSAPMRRAARQAKQEDKLIDLTYGKACLWVLFLDSGHIVLASHPMPVASAGFESDNFEEEKPPWD